jgi:tRNA-Thr(GGU) m(6)t(6)A37 methyltransferase TsaA
MDDEIYHVRRVGVIVSELRDRASAPRQGYEGAPAAWVEVDARWADALFGVTVGDEVIVLTWLDRAQRDVLQVHPRNRPEVPLTGVFATRSPDRPNPIGLHRVRVTGIDGLRLRVEPIEAIDGTPVIDIKPVLARSDDG